MPFVLGKKIGVLFTSKVIPQSTKPPKIDPNDSPAMIFNKFEIITDFVFGLLRFAWILQRKLLRRSSNCCIFLFGAGTLLFKAGFAQNCTNMYMVSWIYSEMYILII